MYRSLIEPIQLSGRKQALNRFLAVTLTALFLCLLESDLLASSAGLSYAPDKASINQAQVSGEYLIWLDASTRAVCQIMKPAANPQRGINEAARKVLWSSKPFKNPTGITVDRKGVIYVIDEDEDAIFSLVPGGEPQVVYAGAPLRKSAAIAAVDDKLYVADHSENKIYAFHLTRKEIVDEYTFGEERPDHLVFAGEDLIALDRQAKVLVRFLLDRTEHPASEGQSNEWRQVDRKGHATFGRGVRINLEKVIGEMSDIAADNSVMYFLDLERGRVVLLPLGGGDAVSVPVSLFAERPFAIAAGEEAIYLAEGEPAQFRRFPALVPITLNFVGDWVAPEAVEFFNYLRVKKLLPTKSVEVKKATTLEALVKNLDIMPTGYIEDFQVLFCQLNASLCTPTQSRLPIRIAGEIPPDYAVRLNAGQSVIVPDLQVTTYSERRNISLPLDPAVYKPEIFGDLYNQPLGVIAAGLSTKELVGEEFLELLKKYNPFYKGQNILAETTGFFGIPVWAGRVQAIVPRDDLYNQNSLISKLAAKKLIIGWSPTLKLQPMSFASSIAVNNAVSPLFAIMPNQCVPVDNSVRSTAMELIKHCKPEATVQLVPPPIGIIDDVFNEKHHAFGWSSAPRQPSALQVYRRNATGEEQALDLGDVDRTSFNEKVDHGTHVAAIIGARPQKDVMVGLFPESDLYGLPLSVLDDAIKEYEFVHLFNVSLGEKGSSGSQFSGAERLKELVVQYPYKMFVIAAGNDGKKVQRGSLASFGYLDNVIVVGATNVPPLDPATNSRSQPGLLVRTDNKGSNTHPDWVSLMAPGQGIKSALYPDGKYGVTDGTSQATAFVTGAAAALKAVEPTWQPWQIKARLVATADLWTNNATLSQAVFAGELNFSRAVLNTKSVYYEHGTKGICRGTINPDSLGRELKIRKGRRLLSIPYERILRVRRNQRDATDYTIIYYDIRKTDNFERINHYLEREVSVRTSDMLEQSFKFNFKASSDQPPNCTSGEVILTELMDFINTFTDAARPDQ